QDMLIYLPLHARSSLLRPFSGQAPRMLALVPASVQVGRRRAQESAWYLCPARRHTTPRGPRVRRHGASNGQLAVQNIHAVACFESILPHLKMNIGRLSPAFPVTPPDMRVRIRRFGGLSYWPPVCDLEAVGTGVGAVR